jgi:predicted Zn-dependent protease with MMP-like domain
MSERLPPPSRRGRLSRRAFEQIVDEALAELPDSVRAEIDNLRILVEEWPSPEQDPTGDGLLGLYDGVSLHDRSADYFGVMPDIIWVFRGPHLLLGLDREGLKAEIRKTVLHELAHHLGIDDARLHELGWD